MLDLNTDITKINRVGIATAKKLKKIGIETIYDLLFYFPFKYDDFSEITAIENLQPGIKANIVGTIELIQNKRSPKKRMNITEALILDETETIKVIWFNQPFIAKNLRVGDRVSLSGKVEDDYGSFVMKSPTYEKLSSSPIPLRRKGSGEGYHTQGVVPNYHLTQNLTQKQVRFLIKQIIKLADNIQDWLPEETKKNQKLLDLPKAIKKIHFPKNKKEIKEARKRLAFNELFLIQLQSQIIKQDAINLIAEKIKFKEKETKKFVNSLPFRLTNTQKKSAWEIIQDLSKEKPMMRLLEGDVGSGKTVVACLAMLNIALNKKQSALMVPTEILANQHFESISKLFSKTSLKIGLITRSSQESSWDLQSKTKKDKRQEIAESADIIIGTHALIQEDINFKNLNLVIIDEQHRFGVEQRKALINKSGDKTTSPHLLSMTATPIPRSLALALYGDLDISIINEMPKGRKRIITKIVNEKKRSKAYQFIREKINEGQQVFVVCPLIDISDKLGVKSVKEEYKKLNEKIFPDLHIEFLHGKLKAKEKDEIMQKFLNNEVKILVSTSVIEVGIDVPNATIIMIEGADRFGLAQLHQFRGRVGRSDLQSYCLLFTDSAEQKTITRLQALEQYNNGFDLAKIDLKFRGPGEVYGTMQKGFPELKIASLFDYELMKQAQSEAIKLLKKDKSLKNWPKLKEKIDIYNQKIHLE